MQGKQLKQFKCDSPAQKSTFESPNHNKTTFYDDEKRIRR